MNVEHLVEHMIRGALGVRGKRHRGALSVLTGRRGSLVNAGTLLAALGVAWGLYETATAAAPRTAAPVPTPANAPAVPPLPVVSAEAGAPVPGGTTAAAPAAASVPAEVARVIRLTVSAARADGTLSPAEESAILSHARATGAERVVQEELRQATPLASLLGGVPDGSRQDLYVLAFTIVRADESVSGAERIYLAQLAHHLGLDPAAAASLEEKAAKTIDAAAKSVSSTD